MSAAERKGWTLKVQLEEVQGKIYYSTAEAEQTIKVLKDQLQQARSNETRSKSYEEEIHKLKLELSEARILKSTLLTGWFLLIRW